MEQSPPWEAFWFSASQRFHAFYGTRRFITAFTSAHHLFLSWARSSQALPANPASWSSILIWSSHLRLCLPRGPFPSGLPNQNPVCTSPLPHNATCPAPLILDLITRIIFGEGFISKISSLCSLLHPAVASSRLGPSNLLNTLFSNTLSPCFSLNIKK